MKYNFSKVKVTDIEGKEVKETDIHKVIGNALYGVTKDLGLVDKARKIYKGEDVELDKVEIEEVKRVIDAGNNGQPVITSFARKAVNDYIESLKDA